MRPKATAERAGTSGKNVLCALGVLCGCLVLPLSASAQNPTATRVAIQQAEDRRAPSAADLATIRAGSRSADAQTVRIAVRALGRLERPALIADIASVLVRSEPENRAEAATAIGQAAQGWKKAPPAAGALDSAFTTVANRLKVEADADVRAALCETIGRLPYANAAQVERAERALVDMAMRADSVTDRLGVAKGFEALLRTTKTLRPASADATALLQRLAVPAPGEPTTGARVRRLSLEALLSAGVVADHFIAAAAHDPDAQVRRIVMRAAGSPNAAAAAADKVIADGLHDDSPIVRIEALRARRARGGDDICAAFVAAVFDRDVAVALVGIDQLSACGASANAVAVLDAAVADAAARPPRAWHRAAHALVALATASPEHAAEAVRRFALSRTWQLRMYAARAAVVLTDRGLLSHFAEDDDDNVREAAVDGLKKIAGHAADDVYVKQLTRSGYQLIRAAALALDGTAETDSAVPALRATWDRLVAEGRDNSHDARDAVAKALASAGGQTPKGGPTGHNWGQTPLNYLTAEELRRLASPRARITIRDVGTFELALFTAQAPATVLRFARLAESGYYNGLTFHRVVPNFVIQGGSPGANEYIGDAMFMRDELGSWPHVRGAVGISTRGRDTGDAQIFIDLVDNPRLDHDYTVFAQVLNGIDIVDQILEGDVIERIEIVLGP